MHGKGSQTTWQRVRGNALLYVREELERSGVCRAELNGRGAAAWCAGAGAGAGAYCVDHPLPPLTTKDSSDSSAPPFDYRSTVACTCTRNSTPCLAGNTLAG